MIRKPRSAQQFCWLYAVACIKEKDVIARLHSTHYERLVKHLEEQTYPPGDLVKRAFPRPFHTLWQHGLGTRIHNMQAYWRECHSTKYEESPVSHCTVTEVVACGVRNGLHKAMTDEGSVVFVTNPHGYAIEVKAAIYAHGGIIAEVIS